MEEALEYLEPIISEKRLWNSNNLFFAIIIATISIMLFITILFLTNIDLVWALILFISIIVIDSITLFFLLEPHMVKEITQPIIKIKERTVDRPIYQQIPIETEKKIYIRTDKKEKKKYKFYGSYKSGTYHFNSCRLSKLIKEDYLVGKNSRDYFTKNQYKPCKVCIQKKFKQLA